MQWIGNDNILFCLTYFLASSKANSSTSSPLSQFADTNLLQIKLQEVALEAKKRRFYLGLVGTMVIAHMPSLGGGQDWTSPRKM